jgi:hypothetical protein
VRPTPEELTEHLDALMSGVNGQLFDAVGDCVQFGPFAGMYIPEVTAWADNNSGTRLIGSYEFELHAVVEKIVARKPDMIVNVGCAEGYYAIGFARLLPHLQVVAIDVDDASLDLCEKYAAQNGVFDRVHTVLGKPAPQELAVGIEGRCLYFVDCEGDEVALLDEKQCPLLLTSDIIVECHDFMEPTISKTLQERFESTHDIEVIEHGYPCLQEYTKRFTNMSCIYAAMAVDEKRPVPTRWLACWTRAT